MADGLCCRVWFILRCRRTAGGHGHGLCSLALAVCRGGKRPCHPCQRPLAGRVSCWAGARPTRPETEAITSNEEYQLKRMEMRRGTPFLGPGAKDQPLPWQHPFCPSGKAGDRHRSRPAAAGDGARLCRLPGYDPADQEAGPPVRADLTVDARPMGANHNLCVSVTGIKDQFALEGEP